MATGETIRAKVKSFLDRTGGELTRLEDAFAPWFVHSQYGLPEQEAVRQASDGSNDAGIDAFCVELDRASRPHLTIVQAKLTDSGPLVRKGIEDLRRGVETVHALLASGDTDLGLENRVIVNLRKQLAELTEEQRNELTVKCTLVHLLPEQELWLLSPAVQKTVDEFKRAVGETALAGRAALEYLGPPELKTADVVPRKAQPLTLRFDGTGFELGDGDRVLFGLGHLADFVELHDHYRMDLFAKNVRMYLHGVAKKEQSAAHQIKDTLDRICEGRTPAAHFAMIHNGITVSVPRTREQTNGSLVLEPGQTGVFILNGCQTVYTAWRFLKDKQARKKADGPWLDAWRSIKVPTRIVVTDREDRVRDVTVGTNRQSSIKPAAFWAHHPTQRELAARLERFHIFYQRQEGAWDHLERSDPARAGEFTNGVMTIEDVARCIGGASRTLPLRLASSPDRIFDSQSAFGSVFSSKHLVSARLLVFLFNLLRATKMALRDLTQDVQALQDLKPGRLMFPAYRLLAHWIVKKQPDDVREYSQMVLEPTPNSDIRATIKLRLRSQHSGLQQVLRDLWFEDGHWQDPHDRGRLDKAFNRMHLANVDVFEPWEELDAEVGEEDDEGE
jgi:hypothetical protein